MVKLEYMMRGKKNHEYPDYLALLRSPPLMIVLCTRLFASVKEGTRQRRAQGRPAGP